MDSARIYYKRSDKEEKSEGVQQLELLNMDLQVSKKKQEKTAKFI